MESAQDFGEMIYYVLKQILKDCYFMVMGDVSQNIHYETGMNDWEGLKEALFEQKKDSKIVQKREKNMQNKSIFMHLFRWMRVIIHV